jgi:hypothetical protein
MIDQKKVLKMVEVAQKYDIKGEEAPLKKH